MKRKTLASSLCFCGRVFDLNHPTCISCNRQNGPCSGAAEAKPSKYRNQKIVVGDEKFDSKKEFQRYHELQLLQRAGKISDLKRQVPFELAPAVKIEGAKRKTPAMKYWADFTYQENGVLKVEDAKGCKTPVYLRKRHLMKSIHNIDIIEV